MTLRTALADRIPRVETLRWLAGVYFVILGASLLILPSSSFSAWLGETWLRGAVTAGSGIALLWVAGGLLPRRVAVVVSILVALFQLRIALDYVATGNPAPVAILGLLALGLLLSPLAPPAQVDSARRRPDALGLILGAAQAVQGLDFLVRPGAAVGIPTQLGVSPTVFGTVFLVAGLAVVVVQLIPGVPRVLYWAAHLVSGGALLGLWLAQSVLLEALLWTLGAAVVVRGIATVALPWWSEWAARFDPQALRPRLALALVTASFVPLLIVLPILLNGLDQGAAGPGQGPDITRARQVAFAVTILAGTAAAVCGWWLAGRLAAPIGALTRDVGRIATGDRTVVLTGDGPTEIARLSRAVETMAVTLDTRAAERDRLIGQLQAQNEELRTLEAAREDSIRAISHDLRNPLTALYGFAQLLARDTTKLGLEKQARLATSIVRLSQNLTDMIQDLAESLRLEAGQVELRPERLDLPDFIADVRERVGEPQQVARVVLDAQADLPPVLADPRRLERVLTNLVSNALKYSPSDAPVTIRATNGGDMVCIAVEDRGQGLTPAEQERLFTRYYRAASAQGHDSGLGLGL